MGRRRGAIRLRVVNRRVVCPYGRNDGNGGRDLGDCYLDSITPQHPCCGCTQVDVWKHELGLRTYRVAPEETSVDERGDPHKEYPFQLVYLPLNLEGTAWYALNVLTGQREEVVLRDGRRFNPEGKDITQEYTLVDSEELDRRIAIGGMVTIPYTAPVWRGPVQREEWRCTCGSCASQGRKAMPDDDENDPTDPMAASRRGHQSAQKPKDAPSVGIGVGVQQPASPAQKPKQQFSMYSQLSDEERQRIINKARAKRGLGSGAVPPPLSGSRGTTTSKPVAKPTPKPTPSGPMTTAQALTTSFKKKTQKK